MSRQLPPQDALIEVIGLLLGMHNHKCPDCKCVWSHDRASADITWAHKCPMCGTEQWDVYTGSQPVNAMHGATLEE